MKKAKEILLLLVLFILSFLLFFVLYLPSPLVAQSDTAFIGTVDYLRLLLKDKTIYTVIINTVRKPFISSVVLILLSCFVLKKKIKFTRKSYYLTSFAAAFIISVVYLITNVVFYNLLGYIFFPTAKGFLIDLATVIICLPTFFGGYSYLYSILT